MLNPCSSCSCCRSVYMCGNRWENTTCDRTFREAYLKESVIGVTWLASTEGLGDYRIRRAGLAESGTLFLGYVLAENLLVWIAVYRCFSRGGIPSYSPLFVFCGILYLPLAITSAVVDGQYNC